MLWYGLRRGDVPRLWLSGTMDGYLMGIVSVGPGCFFDAVAAAAADWVYIKV